MSCSRRQIVWNALTSGIVFVKSQFWGELARAQPSATILPQHVTSDAFIGINRGLNWLAARQQRDGGFGTANSYARNVGVCALSGMAFLAHEGPRGTFAQNIKMCTDYLLGQSRPNGFIVESAIKTHAPMYGHGFATMYLGQVYGADRRAELRDKLKRAASLIIAAQGEQGAWRYTPFPEDADVSVTTCQMMALHSVRQAGFSVPSEVIRRSINFLRRCQNPDGGFRYRLIDPPESSFPRSAAAVVSLCASGLYDDPAVQKGRAYLSITSSVPAPQNAEYYYYGRFYATHAAWQESDGAWDRWYPTVRDELLQQQSPEGNWSDSNIGDEYATAMSLLTLQFPFNCIPLFSR